MKIRDGNMTAWRDPVPARSRTAEARKVARQVERSRQVEARTVALFSDEAISEAVNFLNDASISDQPGSLLSGANAEDVDPPRTKENPGTYQEEEEAYHAYLHEIGEQIPNAVFAQAGLPGGTHPPELYNLNSLGAWSRRVVEAHGFCDPALPIKGTGGVRLWNEFRARAFLASLCLITTEVSEAAEEVRNCNGDRIFEEIADVIIRCLSLAAKSDIDMQALVVAKIMKNEGRPHKHGGKIV